MAKGSRDDKSPDEKQKKRGGELNFASGFMTAGGWEEGRIRNGRRKKECL